MRIAIIVLILISHNTFTLGCDCGGANTFCETIKSQIAPEEYIVKAIKLKDINHGMDVKIINSYRDVIPKDTVRIWGDNGALCRVGTGLFEVGDTIIMNLFVLNDISQNLSGEGENIGDYELSSCGKYYLKVKNNKVVGGITSEILEIDLDEFDELMKEENNFTECISTNTKEKDNNREIKLYPNPVDRDLRISSNGMITGVKIHDTSGRIINMLSNINSEIIDINTSDFKRGIYFIELSFSESKTVIKKFLKT